MEHALERTLSLPLWMRDPQWRWKLALVLRADPSKSIVSFRQDTSLHEAAAFFKSLCQAPDNHVYRRRRFPDMCVAYAMWAGASMTSLKGIQGTGRWRGIIESLILTGLPAGDFSAALGVPVSPRVVRLYHDVFFDVGSYLESSPAVHVNVLSAAEQKLDPQGSMGPMEQNCLLRLFAYTWGAEALVSYFFSRNRGQNMAHSRWLRQLAGDILTRDVVCEAIGQRGAYRKECIDTWKLAQAHWQMPAETLGSVEDEIRKRFLHETVQLLGDRLSRADEMRAMRDISRTEAVDAAM
jgi:hypothetical protein